jgi:hypothetical protein
MVLRQSPYSVVASMFDKLIQQFDGTIETRRQQYAKDVPLPVALLRS